MHTVEVSFEGELLVTYTEGETTYRLYRVVRDGEYGFYIHWTDEQGSWLEYGHDALSAAQVASMWPDLALRAFVSSARA